MTLLSKMLCWFALLVASSVAAQQPAPEPIAIVGVTVIDGTGKPPRPGTTVRIADGRIVSVGASSARPADRVIDGRGK